MSACARLLSRNALNHLQSGEDFTRFRKTETVKELRAELRKRSGYENAEIIYFESPIKFSKVAHPTFEKIRVLVKAPISSIRSLHEIKEKSQFFEKFHDLEIVHFYVEPQLLSTLPTAASSMNLAGQSPGSATAKPKGSSREARPKRTTRRT
jgi:hypothetical protein